MTCVSVRWAKGGVLLEGARESVFVTTADHSFFTEPVSCQVFNVVGSTNVSILVDVHCEYEPPQLGGTAVILLLRCLDLFVGLKSLVH